MLFAYDYTFKWGLFTINAALLLKKDKKIPGSGNPGIPGGINMKKCRVGQARLAGQAYPKTDLKT